MSSQEEINSLTWKYFWEQKILEVFIAIGFGLIGWFYVIGLPIAIGILILDSLDTTINWMVGIFTILILSFVLVMISCWFESNWKKAKYKARKELREVKK